MSAKLRVIPCIFPWIRERRVQSSGDGFATDWPHNHPVSLMQSISGHGAAAHEGPGFAASFGMAVRQSHLRNRHERVSACLTKVLSLLAISAVDDEKNDCSRCVAGAVRGMTHDAASGPQAKCCSKDAD
jgi:hypothetical protein